MGNQICCQQPVSQANKQQIFTLPSHIQDLNHSEKKSTHNLEQPDGAMTDHVKNLPTLTPQIQKVLGQQSKLSQIIVEPFQKQFFAQDGIKIVNFGNDTYYGPLDATKRPIGIGKMYKSNGAYFVGKFEGGKAEGPCFYVLKDGSYYKGDMNDNKAQCQKGTFVSKSLEYVGGFKDNVFDGKGAQRLLLQTYTFDGIYQNGKKKSGTMKWGNTTFQHVYEGSFDQNGQFTGKGKLTDPEGIYEGQFQNGQKHGFGTYFYNSKLRYQGNYVHNMKEGQGKIINNDGSIAYKGIFKKGMPNGKGVAVSKNGTQFQAEWIDGIDARLL